MIIGICCVDHKWGLGRSNGLLFHLPKDMKFFKNLTSDGIVVCGRRTLLSFPGSKDVRLLYFANRSMREMTASVFMTLTSW